MKFKRQEYFRYKKLGGSWRKPRGKHNKMRTYIGGKMASPAIGYGTKKDIRGIHPCGLTEVLLSNIKDLEKIDKKIKAVRISGKVGKKKRKAILEKAKELELKVLNPLHERVEEKAEEDK